MTKKAMIKVLEYKADHIKAKIKPQFFREVAMILKDMRGGGRMSKRIAYEKQCMLCKWTDNTQAQCFCGHLQNMAGCQSFEPDDSKPKIEELKKTALELNMLMCKAGISSIVLDSNYGVSLKASVGLPTEIYIIPSNEEII